MPKPVRILWNADVAVSGAALALVFFSDRTYEYIPHEEFWA